MSSNIEGIYTTLANMGVTVDGKTPTAYMLTELPNALESGHLPARLIEVIGSNAAQGRQVTPQTLGTTPAMDALWIISDLMLWQTQGSGQGVRAVSLQLVRYCKQYIESIRAEVSLVTRATVENVSLRPGLFEYPASSGRNFYGVQAEITIRELIE